MDKEPISLLKGIHLPSDLRQLPREALPQVCQELRQAIIHSLADNPGHFASSLGVVELTVALHYVFDTPYDRIVWDVGHQAAGHKMLTGRMRAYVDEAHYDDVSGYTEPSESPDSYSDMVRILIVPILPSPLCIGGVAFPSVGIDDSHRTNLPLTLFSSTLLLTPSQIAGTVCHSSIRRGSSPSSA